MPEDKTDNKQLFHNVELLDEAIDKRRKVCFHYLEYHTDKSCISGEIKTARLGNTSSILIS